MMLDVSAATSYIDLQSRTVSESDEPVATIPTHDVAVADSECAQEGMVSEGSPWEKVPENEEWFIVDGIHYCYDKETAICRVGDYNMEISHLLSGSYKGCIVIPPHVSFEGKEFTVEEIRAFNYCYTLWDVVLPPTIKRVKGFDANDSLISLIFPNGVEKIEWVCRLSNLRRLILPENPVDISSAFEKLPSLDQVMVYCPEPYEWGEFTFYDTPIENCTLRVPNESIFKYMEAPGWKDFGSIVEMSSPPDPPLPSDVNIYPEITIDMMPVQGGIRLVGYSGNVEVYDLDGKLVANVEVSDGGTVEIAPGIYVVKAGNIRGKICVKY